MRQPMLKKIPLAAIGMVLIAVAVAPVVVGMVRAFGEVRRGGGGVEPTAAGAVAVGFHPAFIACGLLGVVLVAIAIARALRRGHAPGG